MMQRRPKLKLFLNIGLVLLLLKSFLAMARFDFGDKIDTILSLAGAMALAIHILIELKKNFSFRVFSIYAGLSLISLCSVYQTRELGLLMTVLVCMAIRGENFDEVIRFFFQYTIVFFLLINILGSIVGHFVGEPFYDVYLDRGLRYHFGFVHPNTVSAIFLNIVLLWLWNHYDNMHLSSYLKILGTTIAVYYFTRTRTMLLVMIALLLLIYLVKQNWLKDKILSVIAMGSVPAFSVFFYVMSVFYDPESPLIMLADSVLNSRIRLGAYAYHRIGPLTWFGRDISNHVVVFDTVFCLEGFTYDCCYTYLMTHQGVIWLLLIAVCFYFLARRKNNKVNIMLVAWALYAVTEVVGMNVFMCFPLLLTSLLISNHDSNLSLEA